jgi:VWFA-related protein
MHRSTSRVVTTVLALASIEVAPSVSTLPSRPTSCAVAWSQQTPQAPQIRPFTVSITAVPIDVRVLDRKTGKPVTDLKQEDFTILENGVRQDIRHFELQTLESDEPPRSLTPSDAAEPSRLALRTSPVVLVPQRSRVFLFVLGNGRLQGGPVKGLDAAANFVRKRLLPQDHVAVFAHNRATDFTLNHEKAAQVLERFRTENDFIAAGVDHQFAGQTGVYGDLPDTIQHRIDYVFSGTDKMPFRATGNAENARTADRMALDQRRLVDNATDAMIAAGRASAVAENPSAGAGAASPFDTDWRYFNNFVLDNARTLQDMGNLYAAVAYMQKIEGEKHLVFVTESGIKLPRADDYSDLASVAANGRIALDVVMTGQAGDVTNNKLLRGVAEDSGGLASIAETGQAGFDRLDAATRASYLLGYYPKNANWDGTQRTIAVKVNRPGVDLAYRRSYRASLNVPEFDRQAYMTRFRVAAAMRFDGEIKDIGVKLKVSGVSVGGERGVFVDARIDPSRLHFDLRGGVGYGRVDIAVIFMNERDQIIGGTYKKQTAHLEYSPDVFAMVMKEGIPYQVQMRVPSGTRYIRLIVYDYAADLLGTAGAWLNQ